MAQIAHAKMKGWLWVVLGVCVAGWFIGGCASYNVQTQKISQSYELGNIQAAASQISAEADKRGEGKDAVVWRLEQGAVLRAAERFEESNQAFDKAEELVNKYEEAAKMSVSREALATVTNLTTLPYEGFAYDKIMMNTYKALNYLELGDYEKARVELYRAYERQKDAVHINSKRIEKAQEEGEKENLHVNMDKVNNDSRFKNQFDNYYSDLNQLSAYADYVNPATVYLDGLFFMTRATGNSDLERSRNSFERVRSMIGENKYIRQDMETLQQVVNGKPISATTYVFFETGQSPEREQIRIDLPLFIITPGVPYVGAAFPKLKYHSDYISALNVSYDGKTEVALLLSNMDAVVAREFKNELPTIITKTLIASAIKAGATYGAYAGVTKGGKKNTGAGLAVLIAGAIYQVAMNQADLRTWTTLPKEFHFCRIPTPADRKIELEPPYSGRKTPVVIYEGGVNVVWAKSVNRNSPLLVTQFKLKDEVKGTIPSETTASKDTATVETQKPEQPVQQAEQAKEAKEITIPEALVSKDTTQQEPVKQEAVIPVAGQQPAPAKEEQPTQKPEGATDSQEPQEKSPDVPAQPTKKSEAVTPNEEHKIENLKAGQQIKKNEEQYSKAMIRLPAEDITVQIEGERIIKLGKAKFEKINPLITKQGNAVDNNDWNMVIQTGKELIEIDPENFLANVGLGLAYAMLSEFELSIQYFKKTNELISSSAIPFIGTTFVYARKGDKDKAFEFLKFAIDRGYNVTTLKNDIGFPEDFRNDPRLDSYL
ncbi:MAG: hypothetical protein NUV74_16470 [Candidatus Brocadiaceae bacterium]|nr:hypothetical protein [Candidatus Brocadiaceae bacterium]